jgi:hydroxypyruvate reductase
LTVTTTTGDLVAIYRQALACCHAGPLAAAALATHPLAGGNSPVIVLGAGKAARAMAEGVVPALGARVRGGLVVTKDEPLAPVGAVEVVAAGHPVPDARSEAAGRSLLDRATRLAPDEQALVLLSGGASALAAVPAPGLSLADKQATTRALLASGAGIHDINAMRAHLSAIKGGRLLAACAPHATTTFVLSDVIGGSLAQVGSGPTAPPPATRAAARAIAARVPGIPPAALLALAHEAAHAPAIPSVSLVAIGDHDTLRVAAVAAVRESGRTPHLLPPCQDDYVACATRLTALPEPRAGCVYVGGGEPTVRLHSPGRGGRCQQLALWMARALRGSERVFLAAGTDGSDGPTDAAGAAVDGRTWDEAVRRGLDPERALAEFDCYRVHASLGTLIRTGATSSNVCDLHLYG